MWWKQRTLRQKLQHMKDSAPQATRWAGQTYKSGTQERHRTVEGATFTSQNDGGGGISGSGTARTRLRTAETLEPTTPPLKGPRTQKRKCTNSPTEELSLSLSLSLSPLFSRHQLEPRQRQTK